MTLRCWRRGAPSSWSASWPVGHKTAVLWEKLEDLPDGVRLAWRQAVGYEAGYAWFARTLGDLVRSVSDGG